MRIKDIDHALALYEKHNIIRGEALEEGNSSKANYHFDKITEIIDFLKKENAIAELFSFLEHPYPWVRLTTAVHLRDYDERACLEVMRTIEKNEKGIIGLTAKLSIKTWKKSFSDKEASSSHNQAERFKEKANLIVAISLIIIITIVSFLIFPERGIIISLLTSTCIVLWCVYL